jgi:hypothetical protein
MTAFANHGREDIFLGMSQVTSNHWADANATAVECRVAGGGPCSKDGLVSYEPLLEDMLATDILPAIVKMMQTLKALQVPSCQAVDAKTGACTSFKNLSGITVVSNATKAAIDPNLAKTIGLTNRQGKLTGLRNDGSTIPQTTPAYLLTNALSAIDAAFAAYATANPQDAGRQAQWHNARSQLVDQFLKITGSLDNSVFANPTVTKLGPTAIDTIRAQLWAHCPTSFVPPYDKCTWARHDIAANMSDTVGGPTFAGMMDLGDAVRQNQPARTELEALMQYMLDAASQNDALPAVLASTDDILQVLRDDANLLPFYKVAAQAMNASVTDAQGHVTQKSLVDANMALLARISGKAFDNNGTELCSKELDPNQVLSVALANLVTPMDTGDPTKPGETPLEVIIDIIADVNRAAPDQPDVKLDATDYQSISDNVTSFLIDKQRGLEQFYQVIRDGSVSGN